MKKEKEVHASFAVVLQTTKATATASGECLVSFNGKGIKFVQ